MLCPPGIGNSGRPAGSPLHLNQLAVGAQYVGATLLVALQPGFHTSSKNPACFVALMIAPTRDTSVPLVLYLTSPVLLLCYTRRSAHQEQTKWLDLRPPELHPDAPMQRVPALYYSMPACSEH